MGQVTEQVSKDLAKLQAQKANPDSLSRQIQDRIEKEARRREEERLRKLEEERQERQRQEDLKRNREQEERDEEERQAEQKRQQAKWQAEEKRGPRIWAYCTRQEGLLEAFNRQALQVSIGQDGYIILWDHAKGHACHGIPTYLRNKLNGRAYHLPHARLVALSPDSGDYYVQFTDGTSQWVAPDNFWEAVQDTDSPSVVAFGANRSWFVAWPDGSSRVFATCSTQTGTGQLLSSVSLA